jgi:hypothetical protein
VLSEWDPGDPNREIDAALRVPGQGRFHEVKALYVDAYEATARGLTIVTAIINLRDRRDADAYPTHPDLGRRFAPASLDDFHRQSNAPKLAYLRGDPLFESWLVPALDPKLRNAIGHYTAAYDPGTGDISYAVDRVGTRETLSYGQFLLRVFRLVVRTHQLNHLVKMLFVHSFLRDADAAQGTPAPS